MFATVSILSLILIGVHAAAADSLPPADPRPPVAIDHFPDRLHAFVWRNWEMVSLERMAEVLRTTPDRVREVGLSMGLPPHRTPPAEYQQRGYITIIRRNWHLLPYEQLIELLGWDADKLAFALREDDFLWIKLGSFKPSCPPLRYVEPNEAATGRCQQIKAIVSSDFTEAFAKPWTPRFDFLRSLSTAAPGQRSQSQPTGERKIRFLYSYCGVFGDPLLNPELDPYPDGLL